MPTFTFEGLDIYSEELARLGKNVPKMMNAALYDGAKVMADAIQTEIDTLTELEPIQRQGLHDGLGVAHFWQENSATVTKIGFAGYNRKITKRWPRGQPNAMIARSIARGTSWMRANRFIKRATQKARKKCVEAMASRFDKEVEYYTK